MTELKADLRDSRVKGKQLRKIGYIPAIIYGKNLESSLSIQIDESYAIRMLKHNAIGAQIEIHIGKEKFNTMLKEVALHPITNKLLHMDFQALTSGEKVTVKAHLNILNKEAVPIDGVINELVNELSYKALPRDLVDHIDVDLSGIGIGDTLHLKDLAIFKDERYSFSEDPEMGIIHIGHAKKTHEAEEDEEKTPRVEAPSAEVPVIGKEEA